MSETCTCIICIEAALLRAEREGVCVLTLLPAPAPDDAEGKG